MAAGEEVRVRLVLMLDGVLYWVRRDPSGGRARWLAQEGGHEEYRVGDGECTCPGFRYRRRCKHYTACEREGLV